MCKESRAQVIDRQRVSPLLSSASSSPSFSLPPSSAPLLRRLLPQRLLLLLLPVKQLRYQQPHRLIPFIQLSFLPSDLAVL